MNCENICVRSSWQYSLWLERSRDLRKPGGAGRGVAGEGSAGRWAPLAGRRWVLSTRPVGPSLLSSDQRSPRIGPRGQLGSWGGSPQALGPTGQGQCRCL